jgi:glycosyltransferase involved in cell wall biosynthesis
LPIFEAIRIAWDQIQPCEFYMTAAIQDEIYMWYQTLPEEIRHHCHLLERIPRDELLELMVKSRVLLAPSLSDGIPNTLYEAMASGAFPILSPLETITSVVKSETNVLFARNLYPEEIAEALCRSMSDDALVDGAAQRNLQLVRGLADRATIGPRVVANYKKLSGISQ